VRASTLLNAVLELPGVRVSKAAVVGGEVRVTVRLRRRRLGCPRCGFSTRHRYDTRDVDSSWRHLDMAGRVCRIQLRRRRLRCPEHGVRTEGVPFARDGSGHTRDFEDLVAWLVTKTDKTTVAGFARTSWRTVGAICERVAADVLDPDRLCGLVDIGVDEISWRKHHRYLTLVSDHDTGKIIWGKPGKDTDTLNAFFDELPDGAAEAIEAVSMDMGPAYAKAVRERAPSAAICFDPFHVVKLVTDALDTVRRQVWQAARTLPDQRIAKAFKGARWALLKNPGDLTDTQAETLREMKHTGGILWRAYLLKESLREVSPVTSTQPPPASCSIGGVLALSVAVSRSSSKPRAPSASTAPGSTPPSTAGCPTAVTKASTPRSGCSSDAPTASTAPKPPSRS